MNATSSATLPESDLLRELAEIGVRAARVIARVMELEQAGLEAAATWLPTAKPEPASLAEAVATGQGLDIASAALAETATRVEVLARALDRVSRSVRRSVALLRRLDAGWPRAGTRDDRAAMTRRQVARGVAEAIGRESDGEAAERLFDELAERLDDPGVEATIGVLPMEEVVRRICRDLGLATGALRDVAGTPVKPADGRRTTDTC